MSTKKVQEKSLLRRNLAAIIATIIAIVSLIFSGISLYLYYTELTTPSRAKLTIYIEHCNIYYGTANELYFDVFGKIVNDSPLSAFVKKWELFISVNIPYKIMAYRFNMPDQSLSPSEEVSFTMGQTLMGQNDTKLPETAIGSCVATIWFEDHIGTQVAEKEYSFA